MAQGDEKNRVKAPYPAKKGEKGSLLPWARLRFKIWKYRKKHPDRGCFFVEFAQFYFSASECRYKLFDTETHRAVFFYGEILRKIL